MFTRNSFYERYFDKKSTLDRENDILHREIPGRGCIRRFKRWWANLFLLSYDDNKGKLYYVSSHTVRRERSRQFRQFKNIIHPFSVFRSTWEWFMLVICIINCVLFHYESSLLTTDLLPNDFTYYICAFSEIFSIVDIYLNTKTGYVDEYSRKVVLERHVIVIQYFSSKVFLHAMGAIPLTLLMLIRLRNKIGCVLCKSNPFICALRFLNVFRIFRLRDATQVLYKTRENYTIQMVFRIMRIFILGFVTMMMIVLVTDTVSLMRIIYKSKIEVDSLYVSLLTMKFKVQPHPSGFFFIVTELSRLCKTLLLYGFISGFHRSTDDQVTALISFLVANSFYSWCMIECYDFLYRANFSTYQWYKKKDRIQNMLRCRQLPDHLSRKVELFYAFSSSKSYLVERTNGLYIALLDSLKKEIVLNSYNRIMSHIDYFADWPSEVVDEIMLLLKEEIFLYGDVISTPWATGDCLVILEAGVLGVFSARGVETCHLIDGNCFGELSLVTDKEIMMSSVMAISNCKVLYLDKAHFRRLMRGHPKLFFNLKRRIKRVYENKQNLVNIEGVKHKL